MFFIYIVTIICKIFCFFNYYKYLKKSKYIYRLFKLSLKSS